MEIRWRFDGDSMEIQWRLTGQLSSCMLNERMQVNAGKFAEASELFGKVFGELFILWFSCIC